jgi:hypothetical protein
MAEIEKASFVSLQVDEANRSYWFQLDNIMAYYKYKPTEKFIKCFDSENRTAEGVSSVV